MDRVGPLWLLAFLDRGDLGSPSWRWGFDERRTQFIRKHAGEPSWEPARPRHARHRAKTDERRRREGERQTGQICREAIYQRDGGICGICRQPVPADDFHLDHIDPAGPHGPENLRIAHPLCNVPRSTGANYARPMRSSIPRALSEQTIARRQDRSKSTTADLTQIVTIRDLS